MTTVVWPGQKLEEAEAVAARRPEHMYNVYAKDVFHGTEKYIEQLVYCAANGDWMAHAILGHVHNIPGAQEYVLSLSIVQLAKKGTLCDFELYAFGAFLFTIGRKSDALDMWYTSMDPRAMFSASLVNSLVDVTSAVVLNTQSDPLIEPFRAYVVRDAWYLALKAEVDPYAAILCTMLDPHNTKVVACLTKHALAGVEGAARRLFELNPDVDMATRAQMAKSGVQCVYHHPLPISIALKGKRDRVLLDQTAYGKDIATKLYGVVDV